MPSETSSFLQFFVIPVTLRHSRESGNLELLNFQTTFEYCRRPEGLDSRLRGNDDLEITRNPKTTETEHTGFPPARE
ncbi:hypothetical protein [Neisseria sp. Marseille-Q6792]|uniref:hypothetical protein n=1 Tax=Neisseria sp. Marseille-Q6792 TaxID=2937985 RepID=UPI002023F0EE|nr:hypothetical protein [Neisseria sp. Marseille-Q6792]